MSETKDPKNLRELVGYWNEFDVVLTAPFRDRERVTGLFEDRFPFYERIGVVVSDLGKSAFLPHRDLDCSQPIERQHAQLYDIIIPSSKVEIAYFPRSPHFDSGVKGQMPTYHDSDMIEWELMWSTARTSKIPSISLYHEGSRFPYVRGMPNQIDEIAFKDEEEALRELRRSFRQFFSS